MDVNPLTNDDVADILALLDSLPYDELDLETPRFRLTLRRTPDGWTQSTQVLSTPDPLAAPEPAPASAAPASAAPASAAPEVKGPPPPSIGGKGPFTPVDRDGNGGKGPFTLVDEDEGGGGDGDGDGDGEDDAGLVVVRAPLPGTFYRAPRPGAAPFVEVGSRVGADTVIGIVETMKLMNSVSAGVAGVVAEFCVLNAEFAAQGAALLRIRADR
jgi:acetyl-CoA carboxylase biotin carboxyl carrier protein